MSDSPSNAGSVYVAYQGNSYLFGGNAPYVEEMYENYLADPTSVPDSWRGYFDALQNVPAVDGTDARDVPHLPVINAFAERAKQGVTQVVIAAGADSDLGRKRVSTQQLIAAYRNVGQRWADLDPLKRTERPSIPELEPSFYGFSDADLETVFNTSNTFFGRETMSLRELLNALRETYCGAIGSEYMYITDQTQKRWWQEKLESIRSKPNFTAEKKKHILERLTAAEGLERYLHTKYVGQKRFSLEGGESFIAAMDELIQQAGAKGVQEIVIGMAHRGRLNVLVNTLGKMPKDLFAEFDHTAPEELPAGDVKYHQGFSSDVTTAGGPVHLSLAFNPSHLEIVNPVVEGSVRARMDRRGDAEGKQVLPVLVHGDAAFAGQGVNQETLALAATRGYTTGGTVHLIINNQIGFTTSDPRDLRSTLYCTDIVKGVESPVLHVNGDDPEAVVLAVQLALEYRMTFRKDVVVDIICFRKLGHNEQDTPSLTQPLMYKKIAQHPGTRKLYADKLAAQGLGETLGDDMVKAYRAALDEGRHTIDPVLTNFKSKYAVDWAPSWARSGPMLPKRLSLCLSGSACPRRSPRCPTASLRTSWSRRSMPTALPWAAGRSTSTGVWANTWRLRRWWPVAMPCACLVKTPAVARSRTVTPSSTTRTARSGTRAPTFRCRTWRKIRLRSSSSIPSCPKRLCWASSTAMRLPTPTPW